MTSLALPLYLRFIYFFSWLVFGVVGLGLNFVCALLLLLPRRAARGTAVRDVIRRLFSSWVGWLRSCGLVTVTWSGAEAPTWPRPAVYVANHPGLLDASLLLARIPNAICIFKPALRRNPFLAPAALMAGYASGDAGLDLINDVGGRVAAGSSLLIFPEGTRTEAGVACGPLKPGFALVAQRAAVPIQVIVIRAPRDFLPRGRAWWRLPRLPARIAIEVGPRLTVGPDQSAHEITRKVQDYFRQALGPEVK